VLRNWYERLLDNVVKTREPASRTYRYMSRLIEKEFDHKHGGVCLAFFSLDGDKLSSDALLMLAYCLQTELGSKVLVVDARVKDSDGGISQRLGLGPARGYADLLREGVDGKGLPVRASGVPGVDILPIGNLESRTANVDRARLAQLIDVAKSQYNHVLVQVSSVLADTRYMVTVAQADAVFVLALENKTLMRSLDESRKLLRANGVNEPRVVVVGGAE
jgi:cellulose biosynthesis protein BcsQ